MNRRTILFIALVIILAFTLYEELSLRRYLFKQHSYILAGSLPNFLAALLMSITYQLIKPSAENKAIFRSIIAIVSGLILYEIAQLFMPNMVFDFGDVIASILGGSFAYLLIYFINKQFPA